MTGYTRLCALSGVHRDSGRAGPPLRGFSSVVSSSLPVLHNPDTREIKGNTLSDSRAVVDTIHSYRYFISGRRATVSRGEPLMKSEFSPDIICRCRGEGVSHGSSS